MPVFSLSSICNFKLKMRDLSLGDEKTQLNTHTSGMCMMVMHGRAYKLLLLLKDAVFYLGVGLSFA